MRRGSVMMLAVWASSFLASTAQAGLVTNGSFEQGTDPGVFVTLPTGSNGLTGWTISLGGIDYIGSLWQASDGQRSVDLDGHSTSGKIAQDIATVVGQEYELSFDLAGNPDGPPIEKQVRAGAGLLFQDFSFDSSNSTRDDMGWLTKTWRFVADSDVTTIWFQSLTSENGDGSYGAVIDDVDVNAVPTIADTPEPSTLALCLAGSLGGAFLWRRRR